MAAMRRSRCARRRREIGRLGDQVQSPVSLGKRQDTSYLTGQRPTLGLPNSSFRTACVDGTLALHPHAGPARLNEASEKNSTAEASRVLIIDGDSTAASALADAAHAAGFASTHLSRLDPGRAPALDLDAFAVVALELD